MQVFNPHDKTDSALLPVATTPWEDRIAWDGPPESAPYVRCPRPAGVCASKF